MPEINNKSNIYKFGYTSSSKELLRLMKLVKIVKIRPETALLSIYDGEAKILLKPEFQNFTNSFKYRPAKICIDDASKRGFSKVFVDTSGNLGLAISLLAKEKKIFAEILLNNSKYPEKDQLKKNASILSYRDNQPKLLSRVFSVICSFLGIWDFWWFLNNRKLFIQKSKEGYYLAQPSIYINPKSLIGYSYISWETYEQLGKHAPDYVFTSVINSDNAIGQWLGYYALFKEKKISRIPCFVLVEKEKRIKHFNYPGAWKIVKNISEVKVISIKEREENSAKKYLAKMFKVTVEGVSAGVWSAYKKLSDKRVLAKNCSSVLVLGGSNV